MEHIDWIFVSMAYDVFSVFCLGLSRLCLSLCLNVTTTPERLLMIITFPLAEPHTKGDYS